MEHSKTSGGRRFFNTVLILIDLALLVWIVWSWYGQRKPDTTEGYSVSLSGNGSGFDGASGTDSPAASTVGLPGNSDTTENMNADPVGEYTDNWILDSHSDTQASVSDSAAERPSVEELENWKQMIGYIPPDARNITDFSSITGSWKGFVQYDTAEEMVNVTVSGSASSVILTVDWYQIRYSGEESWENEEGMGDTALTGSFTNGGMTVSGAGSISFYAIYESNGQQFAFGEWNLPNGSTALLGMIRP
ncbi:MAG: hypothetical protein IK132_02470 [Clostridia bacterium]|nr:hypothetical protein [Clostridia bacterium]